MTTAHSELEAVPQEDRYRAIPPEGAHSELEAVPQEDGYKAIPPEGDKYVVMNYGPGDKYVVHPADGKDDTADAPSRRICGLRRKTFWLAIGIALLVSIGAILGGVFGSRAASKGLSKPIAEPISPSPPTPPNMAASSSTTPSPTTSGMTTEAPSIALTTTQLIGPTTTLLSDCPSSNNTIFDVSFGAGQDMLLRKFCANDLSSDASAIINQPTESLDDCISACAKYNYDNRTEIQGGSSNVCNNVCWRNSPTDSNGQPGQCFGSTAPNISGTFAFSGGTNCDSAAWINVW
ncbi:hypothetical protein LSUE1_G001550 [Lachnellula suecica]|uniref:WSC domain-containing protein n=1 Tax=Lachnellula suecica TaxID=602035 RepID=A0A8T9CCM7_9HELO|nr:hypothetical protein LSUE1_G001550 [Lachnellula suecica]